MIRAVPIEQEAAERIERLGMDLMRRGSYDDATCLLAIALAWKAAPIVTFNKPEDTYSRKVSASPALHAIEGGAA